MRLRYLNANGLPVTMVLPGEALLIGRGYLHTQDAVRDVWRQIAHFSDDSWQLDRDAVDQTASLTLAAADQKEFLILDQEPLELWGQSGDSSGDFDLYLGPSAVIGFRLRTRGCRSSPAHSNRLIGRSSATPCPRTSGALPAARDSARRC